jgi:uncharacterized protein YggT (Ycf19 family)
VAVLDFILNLTALLLWLNWRAVKFDPIGQSAPATLAGTIRRAEPSRVRPWHSLAVLVLLLFVRAWFYWRMDPVANWTPSLHLGVIAPPFRADFFSRALEYSIFSFGLILAVFYMWLLLLSLLSRGAEAGPIQKLVRLHLGWFDRWWWPLKLVLPFIAVAGFWMAINPLLASYKIVPPCVSPLHRIEQGATIGLAFYVSWEYLLYALLLLYLLSNYVYLGNHPLWPFVTVTGRKLLYPLRFLRIGKVDFAPIIAIVLLFVLAGLAQRKLTVLYTRLPL